MSIGSLGIVGSLAGSSLVQKTADVDKTQRDAADAARQTEAESRAEMASGIGQTEEESQAGDRDADGRRLWERHTREKETPEEASTTDPADSPSGKDPTGQSGGLIDISG